MSVAAYRAPLGRIATEHLFRPLAGELLALLATLTPAEWTARTSAARWRVRDVVAHMLDGDIRRLSAQRDGHRPPAPAEPFRDDRDDRDLVAYLDDLNATWVAAAGRISPRVLSDLLAVTSRAVADLMEAADGDAAAVFPVAWAGRTQSPLWLDIGREYTERWHHQDQIRDATGRAPLSEPRWLKPVVALSLLALPHGYRDVAAVAGTTVRLEITGPAGGVWHLERGEAWALKVGAPAASDSRVRMEALPFARMLLHRLAAEAAAAAMQVDGARDLALPLANVRAVMV